MARPAEKLREAERELKPRVRGVRVARAASHKRRKKTVQRRYAHLGRFTGIFSVIMVLLICYVTLMSHLTALNYSLARAEHQRAVLLDETSRLDDRIAMLTSQDRLAAIAAKLGMRDSMDFQIVAMPKPQAPPQTRGQRLALLSTLGGWLNTAH